MTCPACGAANRVDARFCDACGASLHGGFGERRKVVSILFCDVVGSTALGETTDPETVRVMLAAYFGRMKEIVERYGGTVDKFIGDAVMAVFGVPTAHEDDALRACRAAVEMREVLPSLGLRGRIGVDTGEVVSGTEERLVTGDAVNVAARLEQSAGPDEVLIGQTTFALVGPGVEAEPIDPLTLKGKAQPVPAFRLIRVLDAPGRSHAARFVGRKHELAVIAEAWQRAQGEAACRLVTVVADAGVGKSRLIAEALACIDVRVVTGRCLPYGEGITYWPVVDVVKQLGTLPADPVAAETIRSLLGESAVSASADSIAWAFRKLVEDAAPLAVVFDDIHWGEETFLDLVDHVALLSSGAPVLLLCMGRPELLERRPTWPVDVRLEPLGEREVGELIGELVPVELRERITAAAGGNPLFVGEMLAMSAEAGDAVAVPATLRALLTARLDQLEPAERRTLECASIEGEIFHRGAVQTLVPDEERLTTRIAELVRKELVRPDRTQLPGDDAFRFRHLLARDAAYESLPKATRADLHERLADFLEARMPAFVELDEIVGYHLEQALRYRRELGTATPSPLLAERAAGLLGAAGERALGRADLHGAANLLGRAIELADDGRRITLLLAHAEALSGLGTMAEARDRLERARAEAGDGALAAHADLALALLQTLVDPEYRLEELSDLAETALPIFESADDEAGIALAWRAKAEVELTACRWAASAAALEQALVHADRVANPREVNVILTHLANALYWGATAAREGSRRCAEILDRARGQLTVEANVACYLGGFRAMQGDFERARDQIDRGRTIFEELGHRVGIGAHTLLSSRVHLLAGDVDRAVEELRRGYRIFEEMGETGIGSSVAGFLAEALAVQGEVDEAEGFAGIAREAAADDDVAAQISWRLALSRVELLRGRPVEAERLAAESCERAAATDFLVARGDASAALAAALAARGLREQAGRLSQEAVRLYELKGDEVSAGRQRSAGY